METIARRRKRIAVLLGDKEGRKILSHAMAFAMAYGSIINKLWPATVLKKHREIEKQMRALEKKLLKKIDTITRR